MQEKVAFSVARIIQKIKKIPNYLYVLRPSSIKYERIRERMKLFCETHSLKKQHFSKPRKPFFHRSNFYKQFSQISKFVPNRDWVIDLHKMKMAFTKKSLKPKVTYYWGYKKFCNALLHFFQVCIKALGNFVPHKKKLSERKQCVLHEETLNNIHINKSCLKNKYFPNRSESKKTATIVQLFHLKK